MFWISVTFIIVLAVFIPIVTLSIGTRPLPITVCIAAVLGSGLLSAVSVAGYAIQGGDVVQLLRLERTAGFGRSFLAGLALTAGFVVLLLISALKKLFSICRGEDIQPGQR
jgi:hypothetical protein